jgi:hypothetical protein
MLIEWLYDEGGLLGRAEQREETWRLTERIILNRTAL